MKRRKGYFSISAVAKMLSVHQQTIRMYEKEGLIAPKRSEGNTRMFTEKDIDRLEEIIYLTHKIGVNLAGVEVILKMQKQVKKLQDEVNNLFSSAQGELEAESSEYKKEIKKHILDLQSSKQKNSIEAQELDEEKSSKGELVPRKHEKNESLLNADWDIDYEE